MLLSIHYKTGQKFIKTYTVHIVHIVNFRELLSGFGWILNKQCSLKNIDIFANTISSSDDQINAKAVSK